MLSSIKYTFIINSRIGYNDLLVTFYLIAIIDLHVYGLLQRDTSIA